MALNEINILNAFCTLVRNRCSHVVATGLVNNEEMEVAEILFRRLQDLLDGTNEETSLDFTAPQCSELYSPEEHTPLSSIHDSQDFNNSQDSTANSLSEHETEWSDEDNHGLDLNKFDLNYMKQVVQFAEGRSFSTVKHRFRRVVHRRYISRFRDYVDRNGNRLQKRKEIEMKVMDKFKNARLNHLPVHDQDLRRWASIEARSLKFESFKASESWVNNFKFNNRISSRKITQVVTESYCSNYEDAVISATVFIEDVSQNIFECYEPSQILNTDQSGFKYEVPSTRTLSHVGEKSTYCAAKSVQSTTHSYTIQPTISMSGELIGKLFICLQEQKGEFGPRVKKMMFQASNVEVCCSKSGKMSKELVKRYCEDILESEMSKDFVLLMDSWPGQTDKKIYSEVFSTNVNCRTVIVPPHTTALIQPLDIYFFRQWKIFVKKIYNYASLESIPVKLYERNNIIKIQSLVHNQLSSPKYKPMILYSWYKCGFLDQHPGQFKNVLQVNFDKSLRTCDTKMCEDFQFVVCSWCDKYLCFHHFFDTFHFHDTDS